MVTLRRNNSIGSLLGSLLPPRAPPVPLTKDTTTSSIQAVHVVSDEQRGVVWPFEVRMDPDWYLVALRLIAVARAVPGSPPVSAHQPPMAPLDLLLGPLGVDLLVLAQVDDGDL